jgi:predicted HTH domain antitoxin
MMIMSVQLEIRDDIVTSLKIPLPDVRKELMKELALALYARWALSMGKARQMAGLTKREFLNELASRGIKRHYTSQDLAEDVTYAQSGE